MMERPSLESLTSAFNEFTDIVEKFQSTYDSLKETIDIQNQQLEQANKDLKESIRESEITRNFLNCILENIYSGVIVIDKSGCISVFNKAAQHITGLDKSRTLGLPYSAVFGHDRKDEKNALYTLATGLAFHHQKKNFSHYNGMQVEVEFSTSVIKDDNGEFLGIAEVFNDVSELKKLQDKIIQIETLAALGTMAARVAHEIRNPLGGISGFAGLLNRQIADGDVRKKLVTPIIEGVDRLNRIVNNLLTYTREQHLQPVRTKLKPAIENIIELFTMGVPSKKAEVVFSTEVDELEAEMDVQLIQQVILNLLKNAYDAIAEKGIITINVSYCEAPTVAMPDGDYCRIEIADNGCGIPQNDLPKLFTPFFSTKSSGNGLGLSICKKTMKLHQGDIFVESEENKGTKFTLVLPVSLHYE